MPSTSGSLWMAACETWLQRHGWPHAGRQRKPGMGDFTGTWDLNVEATIESWAKLWVKMRQSEKDARARGLDLFCVWKKHNRSEGDRGAVNAGEGAVIMYARQFFPLVMRLEKLEQHALEADDQFARGWSAHVEYMRKHPNLSGSVAPEEAVS